MQIYFQNNNLQLLTIKSALMSIENRKFYLLFSCYQKLRRLVNNLATFSDNQYFKLLIDCS
jgi:hypothetical protein